MATSSPEIRAMSTPIPAFKAKAVSKPTMSTRIPRKFVNSSNYKAVNSSTYYKAVNSSTYYKSTQKGRKISKSNASKVEGKKHPYVSFEDGDWCDSGFTLSEDRSEHPLVPFLKR